MSGFKNICVSCLFIKEVGTNVLGLHIFKFYQLCPADFPSNLQFQNHWGEFMAYGYKASIGNVEVRFPKRDGSRLVQLGTVGISDGFTKILIMVAIVAFILELDLSEADIQSDTQLSEVLKSFASVKCSYTEFENPSHHYLHSLRATAWFILIFILQNILPFGLWFWDPFLAF